MFLLATIVRLITAVVVGFIVVGIVLHLLEANAGNALVGFVYDVAEWLVTPFKGIFSLDESKVQLAVNWGIAAVVYAIVGGVLSSLLARAGGGARARTA